MKKLISILFFLTVPSFLQAANPLDIVINEVAWMGQIKSPRQEWIELYNNKNRKIDISGWKLKNAGAKGQTLKISKGQVPSKRFFLICAKEMTDCDFIAKGLSLANDYQKNGQLILEDQTGNIIDKTPEAKSKKWPSGSVKTRQTMERKNPESQGEFLDNWLESRAPGGTPKSQNVFSPPRVKNGIGQNQKNTAPGTQNPSLDKAASPGKVLIALSLAILSGITALLLKRKIKKRDF